jgi:aldose 1-epimerase
VATLPGGEATTAAMAAMAVGQAVSIRNGPLEAVVRPDVGGSLAALTYARPGRPAVAVLRAAPPDAGSPLQMASFPLVPFCNRIEHGTFRWHGREVRLPANHPGDRFPLHGYGWKAPWRVAVVEPAAVDLVWSDETGSVWPWPYAARQRYELASDALVVSLALRNLGATPMPAGLGHHPYFPRSDATRVYARLPVLWEPDDRLIPRGPVPNPLAAEFASGARIAAVRLDAGYTGWDGRARIEQPDDGLCVELLGAPGDAFHLYVPDAPLLCAEAVTNQPNAINDPRAEAPMRALAPGATLHHTLRLRVTALPSNATTQTSTAPE